MATMTNVQPRRTPSWLPRFLLEEQIAFAALVWAGFVAFVAIATVVASNWVHVEVSVWDQASQAARWFALFIGVYVGSDYLQLHITHGHTRREFMRQAVVFVAIYAAGISLLVTVTFVLEAGLYVVAGWPREVQEGQLFDSASQLHLIFVQSWLLVGLWTAGGLLMSIAWYRDQGLGALLIPFAVFLAGISGIALSADWGPFGAVYERLFGEDSIGGPLAVLVHLGLIALVLGLTWLVVRDIPVRSKKA